MRIGSWHGIFWEAASPDKASGFADLHTWRLTIGPDVSVSDTENLLSHGRERRARLGPPNHVSSARRSLATNHAAFRDMTRNAFSQ